MEKQKVILCHNGGYVLGFSNPNYRSTANILEGDSIAGSYDNPSFVHESSDPNGDNRSSLPSESDPSYEPHRFGNTKNPTTFFGTVFHLYMISSGPALLSVPIGFMKIGYIPGLAITFFVFLYYWYALRMICWSEYELCKLKRQPRMTYPEMLYNGFVAGPRSFRWFASYASCIIQVLYIITWIGSLNIVLMSENLQVVYNNLYGQTVSMDTVMLFAFVPLLLLTWVHRLKYLVPLSLAGTGILIICVFFVLYHVFFDDVPLNMPPAFGSFSAIPLYLGALLFNLNATGLVMPLKNEMKKPKSFNSPFGVLTVTYLPMAFWYAIFNIFCCMRYGNDLRVSVIENLPADDTVSQIIIVIYTCSLAVQQPLITYVVFHTIWNNIMGEMKKSMSNLTFWEYVVRTLVYFASFAAAYSIPNINVFLSISGTVGTAVDSMIFPAAVETMLEMRVRKGCVRKWVVVKNGLILLLAVIVLAAGITTCVEQISDTIKSSKMNSK